MPVAEAHLRSRRLQLIPESRESTLLVDHGFWNRDNLLKLISLVMTRRLDLKGINKHIIVPAEPQLPVAEKG